MRAAELVIAPETVLDYAVFRVPDVLEVSPLKLAGELPSVGEPVTACISVGETQGFHDGTVTGVNRAVPIQMGGGRTETITDLIETDIKVKPGACGSPLVRKDGHIVGVLVAGNGRSYALTALRLRDMLSRAGLQ
jgi:S1-C subfamily serine protease